MMLTRRVGIYSEMLVGDSVLDSKEYDYGLGAAIRVLF